MEAAQRAESRGWEMAQQETEEMNKALEKNGIKVVKPNPELSKSLKAIGEQMTESWVESAGDVGQSILSNYK